MPALVPHRRRAARRGAVVSTAVTAGVLLLATPASAHVTVATDDSARGAADAILTFRVPNEDDSAVTTKIDIKFPTKTPIASVLPAPKPGWTVTTRTVKFSPPIKTDDGTITEGVGEVIYTASSAANGIPAGGFEAFQILVGPLPDTASVAFPTVQTYDNGKTAAWVEPVTDPGSPPDNPAPLLELAAAGGGSAAPAPSAAPAAAPSVTAVAPDLSRYATSSEASTARTIGIAGVVLGLLGLLVGALGLARSRRATSATSEVPELTHR